METRRKGKKEKEGTEERRGSIDSPSSILIRLPVNRADVNTVHLIGTTGRLVFPPPPLNHLVIDERREMVSMPRVYIDCHARRESLNQWKKRRWKVEVRAARSEKSRVITNARSILISSAPFTFDSLFGSPPVAKRIANRKEAKRKGQTIASSDTRERKKKKKKKEKDAIDSLLGLLGNLGNGERVILETETR